MVDESKQHEEEDRRRVEDIQARNEADTLIYTAEKLLKDNEATIDADDKSRVEEGVASLRSALEGEDLEAIKSAHESLQEAVFAVTTKIYQQAQEAQAAAGEAESASASGDDDTVVDADYEVKDS